MKIYVIYKNLIEFSIREMGSLSVKNHEAVTNLKNGKSVILSDHDRSYSLIQMFEREKLVIKQDETPSPKHSIMIIPISMKDMMKVVGN